MFAIGLGFPAAFGSEQGIAMSNHISINDYQETLPFPTFGSGTGENSGLKTKVMQSVGKLFFRFASADGTAKGQGVERFVAEPVVLSQYHVDDFGRPRALTKLEAALHALAWPAICVVILSVALAVIAAHIS